MSALLEAHFEVRLSILFHLSFANACIVLVGCRRYHATFVFRGIVELVTAEGKVGFSATNSIKYLISVFLSLLSIVCTLLPLAEALLGRGLREFKIRSWQV